MEKTLLLFLSTLLLLIAIPFSSANSDSNPTAPPSAAHTELTNYGFPIGLLPADVRTYSINGTSGDFYVDFGGSCRVTLPPDNYLATYSKRIQGRIIQGRIAELDGIRVRAFFRWWSITGIRASGDNLVFEVGSVTAKYPSKNFVDTLACDGNHAAAK